MKLRSIAERPLIITGATDWIRRNTARIAEKKDANPVLIAGNENSPRKPLTEINSAGNYLPASISAAAEHTRRAANQKHKKLTNNH